MTTDPLRSPAHLPTLLFVHGWAFDASFWAPLQKALSAWPQKVIDRGYFGTPISADIEGPVVLIGHSFGFMDGVAKLAAACASVDASANDETIAHFHAVADVVSSDHEVPENGAIRCNGNVAALIGINAFTRFSASTDFPDGVSVRVLERMLSRLRTDPRAVVDDFRQRCGSVATSATAELTLAPLLTDLIALRDDDRQAVLSQLLTSTSALNKQSLLLLSSDADVIVSPAMTRSVFANHNVVWRDNGDHLLPTTATDWCAQHIEEFLRTLTSASQTHHLTSRHE